MTHIKKNNGPEQRQHVCISLARQLTNNIGLKQLGTTSNMQNKSHTFCWIFLCMFMIFIYLQNHRCISIKTFEITQIKTRGLQLRLKSQMHLNKFDQQVNLHWCCSSTIGSLSLETDESTEKGARGTGQTIDNDSMIILNCELHTDGEQHLNGTCF